MQRRAERVETCQRKLAIDHRLMREGPAGATVFFRHGRAQQTCFTRLGPDVAIVDMRLVPAIEVRDEFIGDEAPGLFFKEDKVFAHPGRARKIECVHDRIHPATR